MTTKSGKIKPAQGEGVVAASISAQILLVVPTFLQSFKCPFCEFGEP
jgi:hypothetical protein